jgi:hypothetical protein
MGDPWIPPCGDPTDNRRRRTPPGRAPLALEGPAAAASDSPISQAARVGAAVSDALSSSTIADRESPPARPARLAIPDGLTQSTLRRPEGTRMNRRLGDHGPPLLRADGSSGSRPSRRAGKAVRARPTAEEKRGRHTAPAARTGLRRKHSGIRTMTPHGGPAVGPPRGHRPSPAAGPAVAAPGRRQ